MPDAAGAVIVVGNPATAIGRSVMGFDYENVELLHTDDFDRDYARYKRAGVDFIEEPRRETYGKVVVFRDLFGNLWDLVAPSRKQAV